MTTTAKGVTEAIIEKYASACKRNAYEMKTMPMTAIRQHFSEFADEIVAALSLPAPGEGEAEDARLGAIARATAAESQLEMARKALEDAFEQCAVIAEIDMRSPTAKAIGHKPEWYKHGLSIAKRIRIAARALADGETK